MHNALFPYACAVGGCEAPLRALHAFSYHPALLELEPGEACGQVQVAKGVPPSENLAVHIDSRLIPRFEHVSETNMLHGRAACNSTNCNFGARPCGIRPRRANLLAKELVACGMCRNFGDSRACARFRRLFGESRGVASQYYFRFLLLLGFDVMSYRFEPVSFQSSLRDLFLHCVMVIAA